MPAPCKSGCDEGTVTETVRYAAVPPGDTIWENGPKAWPPLSVDVFEVTVTRPCCRCGGTGEAR